MIYSLILYLLYLETSFAYSFQEEPEDTNAIVGMSVTLRCIVTNWGSMNILWYDHGNHRYISRDRLIYRHSDESERFSIIGDALLGEYFLHIRNITSEDAGLYSCLLFQDRSFRLSSRDALLQVFPEPSKGFPVCSMTPDVVSGGTGPGDWIMLSCVAEGGSPFSRLDWVRSMEILPASFLDENEPRSVYEFRVTEYHNGAVFSCVESNPVLEHTRSCSVMPFYKPTNVSLSSRPRLPTIGDDVTVTCGVQAVPDHGMNYTWFLNGAEMSIFTGNEQFSFSVDGSQVFLQSINASFNNSHFECHVLTIIELEGRASLQLTLLADKLSTVEKAPFIPVESRGLPLVVPIGGSILFIIILIVIVLIISYRRKRVGILHLLKARRSSLRLSQRYTEHHRYTRSSEIIKTERDDDEESTHSVLICATPRDAIQEHLKETSGVQQPTDPLSTRPKFGPPPPPRTESQNVSQSRRGRSRPVISGPISPVIPDLQVSLRSLNIKNPDTSSIDEDYVSDTDTDWDL